METKLAELRKKKKSKKGFTLVELVIVIAVLAIIAGIAIPTVQGVIKNANTSADSSNAQNIETAIKSAQSEVAASSTNTSAAATNLKSKSGTDATLDYLLSQYGVTSSSVGLTADHTSTNLKEGSSYYFAYNTTTGKVIVSNAATVPTGYDALETDTKYSISDNTLSLG